MYVSFILFYLDKEYMYMGWNIIIYSVDVNFLMSR